MQFLNKANGQIFNVFTAKEIAYFAVEGVDVHASPKEWKRINKRVRQMGLVIPAEPASMTEISSMEIDMVIESCDLYDEVEFFLEEMYIMGMLEEPEDEDD